MTLLLVFPILASTQTLPENAKKYGPLLKQELEQKWPEQSLKSYFAGQIEQETCVNLTSKKCWSPLAELKTSREYGFGLGQITKTERFDNFEEAKKLDKSLASWKWDNRYDPTYQIRTLVLSDKNFYNRLPKTIIYKLPFMFSAYNGGLGGVLNDRRLCENTKGCNPDLWYDHVEKSSFKSKIKPQGYGKSFYEINREYVRNIMLVRYKKYITMMNS